MPINLVLYLYAAVGLFTAISVAGNQGYCLSRPGLPKRLTMSSFVTWPLLGEKGQQDLLLQKAHILPGTNILPHLIVTYRTLTSQG